MAKRKAASGAAFLVKLTPASNQSRQTVGRCLLRTVVPAPVLQCHSILPAWVCGENTSILVSMAVLALRGAVLENVAVILPAATSTPET